jgi:prolyl oligopeptidase
VIWVTAHIRGGGEYGLPWHDGGRRAHKQNGFDDFAAVLDHLVAQGYTTPAQTGIIGASNGAILMGAMLAQHPEKMGAVVSQVGIYDMLRLEDHPNGRLLAGEYGSVAHPEDFEVLRAYSPYHNLREGRAYPATLITAGANDSRADPMHSRKFAARLQAAQTGPAPILLRIYTDQGHLAGSLQQQMEKQADITAFLLQHLEG